MWFKFLCEFLGTAMLILLGDGVVANVTLNKSNMKGAGPIQITIAWGLAVLIPACIYGAASGAHFNPALTVGLAAAGQFEWVLVPGYIIAQIAGGFFGGCIVYSYFKDQFLATEDPNTIRSAFCTSPAVFHPLRNCFCEACGTFVLVFTLMTLGNAGGSFGVDKLFVFAIIMSVGMSLGGTTGYAINPARDLGPRLAHAVLPIPGKGSSRFDYGWVPVVAPMVGGVLGAYAAVLIF